MHLMSTDEQRDKLYALVDQYRQRQITEHVLRVSLRILKIPADEIEAHINQVKSR